MRRCARLFVVGVLCFLVSWCAAGKVYIAQSTDDQASCSTLENELEGAQRKIKTLEDLRDAALSAAGFAFPPLGILNAILTVSDSHVADLAETRALKDRSHGMVAISNQKECGYKYTQRNTGQRDAGLN